MDDYTKKPSSSTSEESEIAMEKPGPRLGIDDAERDIELPDLRIRIDEDGRGEGEGKELAQLQSELSDAKVRHTKAAQDVNSPGWGRWVKYVFLTATENANTVESSDFMISRIALIGSVGMAGTAVAYLLPALDMSQIQSTDRATNTTSPNQALTDHANVVYYWGNAASLGYTSIATFIGGLAGIRKSYKAMRERILEQATLERDQAQANLDTHLKYTATLREMQGRCDAAEKSRVAAMDAALENGRRAQVALADAVKVERELGAAKAKSATLEEALRQSDKATHEEQDRARGLKAEIDRLNRELEKARADGELSRVQAEKQRVAADGLDHQLREAKQGIEKQALRIESLELKNETSVRVISMLETALTKIDQADQKIENVSTKINLLSEQAQAKVSVSPKEDKD